MEPWAPRGYALRPVRRWARTTYVATLLASGCAIGFPDGRRPVEHVEVRGAEALDEDDVADGLANHPPRGIVFREVAPFDDLVLELDRRRIESYYRTHGFFSVKVSDAVVAVEDSSDPESDVRIVYDVVEGPPSKVVGVEYTATSTAVTRADLEGVSAILVGERFLHEDYETTKAAFSALLEKRGHPRSTIEGRVEVDRDAREVFVRIQVDPGPLVHFDAITFDPSEVPQEAVEARIAWERGDVYDPEKLRLTEGRLYTLDLVGSVRFTPKYHSNDALVDLSIGFVQSSYNELRLGGGLRFDTRNLALNTRASYTRRYFFHPLMSFNADLRPQILLPVNNEDLGYQIDASAKIIRDDFVFSRLRLTTGVTYRLTVYEAFATQGPTVQAIVGRAFLDDDRLQASISVNGAYLDVFDFDRIEVAERPTYGLYDRLPLFFVASSVAYDQRDNPLSPHAGYFLSLPLEAGKLFDSNGTTYLKATPEVQGYLPVGTPRIVLAGRLRLGSNLLDKPLPITQRYFSGGSDSVRSFGRRRLSPGTDDMVTNDKGEVKTIYYPLGGEAMFVANAEVRFEIVRVFGEWFGLVGFLDAGDTTNAFDALQFDRPHFATGAGMRYHTPVGPLRFDVGFRMNRTEADEPDPPQSLFDRFQYHVSIGEAF